jgi:hypothetical protein
MIKVRWSSEDIENIVNGKYKEKIIESQTNGSTKSYIFLPEIERGIITVDDIRTYMKRYGIKSTGSIASDSVDLATSAVATGNVKEGAQIEKTWLSLYNNLEKNAQPSAEDFEEVITKCCLTEPMFNLGKGRWITLRELLDMLDLFNSQTEYDTLAEYYSAKRANVLNDIGDSVKEVADTVKSTVQDKVGTVASITGIGDNKEKTFKKYSKAANTDTETTDSKENSTIETVKEKVSDIFSSFTEHFKSKE